MPAPPTDPTGGHGLVAGQRGGGHGAEQLADAVRGVVRGAERGAQVGQVSALLRIEAAWHAHILSRPQHTGGA